MKHPLTRLSLGGVVGQLVLIVHEPPSLWKLGCGCRAPSAGVGGRGLLRGG